MRRLAVSLLLLTACQPLPSSQPAPSPTSTTAEPSSTPVPRPSASAGTSPSPQPTALPSARPYPQPTPYPTPAFTPTPPTYPSAWPTHLQPQGPAPTPRPSRMPPISCSHSFSLQYQLSDLPMWSADSRSLSWASHAVTHTYRSDPFCGENGTTAFDQINVRTDGRVDALLPQNTQGAQPLAWRPATAQLLYSQPVPNGGYSYPFVYLSENSQTSQLSTTTPIQRSNAAWAADGNRLALQRPITQQFERSAVGVLTPASHEFNTLLTLEPAQDVGGLGWWPDQQSLLIILMTSQTQTSLQRLGPDGSLNSLWQPETRPEPQQILSFRFSPDGRQLAWVVQRLALNDSQTGVYPQHFLYLADTTPAGLGRVRQISGLQRVGEDFCWSPDSRYLAVSEGTLQFEQPDSEDLFRVNTQDDSLLRLTRDGESDRPIRNRQPAWSPDDRLIAFSSNRQTQFDKWYAQPTDIFTLRPDGSGLKQVTETRYSEKTF